MGNKTVFVVEDDYDILLNMREFLESEGYAVQTASDGLAALETLRSGLGPLPNVILLDLMMPRMDGIGFRAEQEKDPRLAGIPVVLMTASSQGEIQKRKLGLAGFVKKPIDIDVLSELLKGF